VSCAWRICKRRDAVLFLIPGIASGVLFVLLWRAGLLSRPGPVGACCVTGITLQFFLGGRSTSIWLAGLLINVAVGVYLSIRLKVS
jgi:hypothetical protein